MAKSRYWIFTLNNPTQEEILFFENIKESVQKLYVGKEVGQSGTEHLQGIIGFKRQYRLAALKKLSPRAHWEISKTEDAEIYCSKENLLIKVNNSQQGKRKDIDGAMEMVRSKRSRLEIMEECPTVVAKFGKFLNEYEGEVQRYAGIRHVLWVYGEPGTGKTKNAYTTLRGAGVSMPVIGDFWLDYRGEQYVILDDFRHNQIKFAQFLRLCDQYPYSINIKNGHVSWNAKVIVITCPYPPEMEFANHKEDIQQVLRRIEEVYKFPDDIEAFRDNIKCLLESTSDSRILGVSTDVQDTH